MNEQPLGGRSRIISLSDGQAIRLGGCLVADTVKIDGRIAIRPLRLPTAGFEFLGQAAEILKADSRQCSGVWIGIETSAQQLVLEARIGRGDIDEIVGTVNCFSLLINDELFAEVLPEVSAVDWVSSDGMSHTFTQTGSATKIRFDGLPQGEKKIRILLPQAMIVDLLSLSADASLRPLSDDWPEKKLWVHYGSSISHCAYPESPTAVWPTQVGLAEGIEWVNLGFGGECMLDGIVADAIAESGADVISISPGVNITGARAMNQRTFIPAFHSFIDRIRLRLPDVPIVVLSSIMWPNSEDIPGPATFRVLEDGAIECFCCGEVKDIQRGALTLAHSRELLSNAVKVRQEAGENIHYVNGLELFGPSDVSTYTLPDSLHPDAALYREMGERFRSIVFGEEGIFHR